MRSKAEVQGAWALLVGLKADERTPHDITAACAVARWLDDMDRTAIDCDRAIAHYTEEIERLKRAPQVNDCEMLPQWESAINNCEIYIEAIERMKGVYNG